MAKFNSLTFASLFLLALCSCQSLEQISIDYMRPAEVSFPPQLRKVAIVNNANSIPDNKLNILAEKPQKDVPEMGRATAYANGDISIAAEAMAIELANQNYFDAVVICDSALRANDRFARESTLSQEEVGKLTSDLKVDFIIALENLQFKATKTVRYLPELGYFQSTADVKAYPTVKVYLPQRSKPMTTLHPNDSIFWEEFGNTAVEANTRLTPDSILLKEASEFAGTIPVKQLVPFWKKGVRHLYTGGSPDMRDAAVYVREKSWNKAFELWQRVFETTQKKKKKMQAALNIALHYEMADSLVKAEEWAVKAQTLAKQIDKVDKAPAEGPIHLNNIPNFYLTTLYVNELKERNTQLPKLNMQMSRFNDDF